MSDLEKACLQLAFIVFSSCSISLGYLERVANEYKKWRGPDMIELGDLFSSLSYNKPPLGLS